MKTQVTDFHPDLSIALDIILAAGGKRIRPTITILVGTMLGASIDRLITLGAAIEMLHTATLVHDDLIDQSLLRRGTKTLNSMWSPNATVLTGDFIFACAAKLAADVDSLPVMKLFAKTLTVIVNGEITQFFASNSQISRDQYYQQIYSKTASLLETASHSPALISPVDSATVDNMRHFGRELGMAFQIMDDILDFTGEQTTLGKPIGSDLRHGLTTLPTLYYFENNPDDQALELVLNGNGSDSEMVDQLIETIRNSGAIQLAHDEAKRHLERSLEYLKTQPDSQQRQSLEELANYIIYRQV